MKTERNEMTFFHGVDNFPVKFNVGGKWKEYVESTNDESLLNKYVFKKLKTINQV